MFRKILKASPLLFLLCDPSSGLLITSPIIRDHDDLDGLTVGDDHTQYQKESEKDQANGYPGLDGSSKLTGSQQTYGTATDTAAEGNDVRIPTTGENDALQGTTGTPSNTNRYVTDEDNRVDIHWDLKTAGEGSFEVFAGTPDIKSPAWDSADLMGYLEVIGGAADDKGGVVYEFIIPEGVTTLSEVRCTGKLGTVSQDVINMRVKREDGTQIGSTTITAATETEATISSWSPSPTLVAGTRIIVEFEYVGDSTEDGFLGSCRVKMARE